MVTSLEMPTRLDALPRSITRTQMHHASTATIAARRALASATAALLLAGNAAAQSNPFPVEPSMVRGEDAFPVPKRRTELEINYFYSTANSAFDSDSNTFDRGPATQCERESPVGVLTPPPRQAA